MNILEAIAVNALYLVAVINPVSKVAIITGLPDCGQGMELRKLAAKSSAVAACILLAAMVAGDFILRSVFRVELYSFKISGGVVVFWVGMNALRRGVFFEQKTRERFSDMAIVPLACPMIAGPASIAACIGLPAHHGMLVSVTAVLFALGINHLVMIAAPVLGNRLNRFNILGAIIRITGLVVMTIGTQMALDGISAWIKAG